MGKVEIEIYMSNFIGFFEKNADQLSILIGDILPKIFFDEVRKITEENLNQNKEMELTKKQLIDLLVNLNSKKNKKDIKTTTSIFFDHHMGNINLN